MYISSKSPYKNALFTSICVTDQLLTAAKDSKTRTVVIFATGANASK